jgi:UDP-N-acetylglucosamine:LPS N-acetylglucosamine transferase
MTSRRRDVLLTCSSGGHLSQLLALAEAWRGYRTLWVSEDTPDARSLLEEQEVVWAYGPAHRNLALGVRRIALAWLKNLALGVRIAVSARPQVVVTTGAGVAVPIVWAAWLFGARVIFIESLTRVSAPSMTHRLLSPIAERIYVQWPELAQRKRRSRYAGSVLGAR